MKNLIPILFFVAANVSAYTINLDHWYYVGETFRDPGASCGATITGSLNSGPLRPSLPSAAFDPGNGSSNNAWAQASISTTSFTFDSGSVNVNGIEYKPANGVYVSYDVESDGDCSANGDGILFAEARIRTYVQGWWLANRFPQTISSVTWYEKNNGVYLSTSTRTFELSTDLGISIDLTGPYSYTQGDMVQLKSGNTVIDTFSPVNAAASTQGFSGTHFITLDNLTTGSYNYTVEALVAGATNPVADIPEVSINDSKPIINSLLLYLAELFPDTSTSNRTFPAGESLIVSANVSDLNSNLDTNSIKLVVDYDGQSMNNAVEYSMTLVSGTANTYSAQFTLNESGLPADACSTLDSNVQISVIAADDAGNQATTKYLFDGQTISEFANAPEVDGSVIILNEQGGSSLDYCSDLTFYLAITDEDECQWLAETNGGLTIIATITEPDGQTFAPNFAIDASQLTQTSGVFEYTWFGGVGEREIGTYTLDVEVTDPFGESTSYSQTFFIGSSDPIFSTEEDGTNIIYTENTTIDWRIDSALASCSEFLGDGSPRPIINVDLDASGVRLVNTSTILKSLRDFGGDYMGSFINPDPGLPYVDFSLGLQSTDPALSGLGNYEIVFVFTDPLDTANVLTETIGFSIVNQALTDVSLTASSTMMMAPNEFAENATIELEVLALDPDKNYSGNLVITSDRGYSNTIQINGSQAAFTGIVTDQSSITKSIPTPDHGIYTATVTISDISPSSSQTDTVIFEVVNNKPEVTSFSVAPRVLQVSALAAVPDQLQDTFDVDITSNDTASIGGGIVAYRLYRTDLNQNKLILEAPTGSGTIDIDGISVSALYEANEDMERNAVFDLAVEVQDDDGSWSPLSGSVQITVLTEPILSISESSAQQYYDFLEDISWPMAITGPETSGAVEVYELSFNGILRNEFLAQELPINLATVSDGTSLPTVEFSSLPAGQYTASIVPSVGYTLNAEVSEVAGDFVTITGDEVIVQFNVDLIEYYINFGTGNIGGDFQSISSPSGALPSDGSLFNWNGSSPVITSSSVVPANLFGNEFPNSVFSNALSVDPDPLNNFELELANGTYLIDLIVSTQGLQAGDVFNADVQIEGDTQNIPTSFLPSPSSPYGRISTALAVSDGFLTIAPAMDATHFELVALSIRQVPLTAVQDADLDFYRGFSTDPGNRIFLESLDGEVGRAFPTFDSNLLVEKRTFLLGDQFSEFDRIPVTAPLAGFGSVFEGSLIYTNQAYAFSVYAGDWVEETLLNGAPEIEVKVYPKSVGSDYGSENTPFTEYRIDIPNWVDGGPQTPEWSAFAQAGYSLRDVFTHPSGLQIETVVTLVAEPGDPDILNGFLRLEHLINSPEHIVEVSVIGKYDGAFLSTEADGSTGAYSPVYALSFDQRPRFLTRFVRSTLDGTPAPPYYVGKSPEEISADPWTIEKPIGLSITSDLVQLGKSPELRVYPELNAFLDSLNYSESNPWPWINYVHNEIKVVDLVGETPTRDQVELTLNPRGFKRGAYATWMEGQGSPSEINALLIYGLRHVGVNAAYASAPLNRLHLNLEQASRLLGINLLETDQSLLSGRGEFTNTLIPVNYDWVVANFEGAWVDLFPWLKDWEWISGEPLTAFLGTYASSSEWGQDYLDNDLLVPGADVTDDQVSSLFKQFVENEIKYQAENDTGEIEVPGQDTVLSIEEVGTQVKIRNREFQDFATLPQPFTFYNSTEAIYERKIPEALFRYKSSYADDLNWFDSISVSVYPSDGSEQDGIFTDLMLLVDLHNRPLVLTFDDSEGLNDPRMQLTLQSALDPLSVPDPQTPVIQFPYVRNALTDPNRADYNQILERYSDETSLNGYASSDLMRLQIIHRAARPLQIDDNSDVDVHPWDLIDAYGLSSNGDIVLNGSSRYISKEFLAGDSFAIVFNSGQFSERMVEYQANIIAEMERRRLFASSYPTPLQDQIYGNLLYFMGAEYWRRVDAFDALSSQLHETQRLEDFGILLAGLNASRDSSGSWAAVDGQGSIIGTGELLFNEPSLDLLYQNRYRLLGGVTDTGNSLAATQQRPYTTLRTLDESATLHDTIETFFPQTEAFSAVKLIREAYANNQNSVTLLNTTNYQSALASSDLDSEARDQVSSFFAGDTTERFLLDGYLQAADETFSFGNGDLGFTGSGYLLLDGYGEASTSGVEGSVYYTGTSIATSSSSNLPTAFDPDSVFAADYSYTDPRFPSDTVIPVFSPRDANQADDPVSPDVFNLYHYSVSQIPGSSAVRDWVSQGIVAIDRDTEFALQNAYRQINGITTPDHPDYQDIMNPPDRDDPTYRERLAEAFEAFDNGSFQQQTSALSAIGASGPSEVSLFTGQLHFNSTDLVVPGPLPLSLTRSYYSGHRYNGHFGVSWRMAAYESLGINSEIEDHLQTNIFVTLSNGSVVRFADPVYHVDAETTTDVDGNWTYVAWSATYENNPTFAFKLLQNLSLVHVRENDSAVIENEGKYVFTNFDESKKIYESRAYEFSLNNARVYSKKRPILLEWQDMSGNALTFTYGEDSAGPDGQFLNSYGQIVQITSDNNQSLSFEYNVYGQVSRAWASDGRIVEYTYDQYGDLVEVLLPDASKTEYRYKHFTSNVSGSPLTYSLHLIDEVVRPNGRYAEYIYDQYDRVIEKKGPIGPDLTPETVFTLTYDYNILGDAFNEINYSGEASGYTYYTNAKDYTMAFWYDLNRILGHFETVDLSNPQNPILGKQLSRREYFNNFELETDNGEILIPGGVRSVWVYRDEGQSLMDDYFDDNGNVLLDPQGNPLWSGTYPAPWDIDDEGLRHSFTYDIYGNMIKRVEEGNLTGAQGATGVRKDGTGPAVGTVEVATSFFEYDLATNFLTLEMGPVELANDLVAGFFPYTRYTYQTDVPRIAHVESGFANLNQGGGNIENPYSFFPRIFTVNNYHEGTDKLVENGSTFYPGYLKSVIKGATNVNGDGGTQNSFEYDENGWLSGETLYRDYLPNVADADFSTQYVRNARGLPIQAQAFSGDNLANASVKGPISRTEYDMMGRPLWAEVFSFSNEAELLSGSYTYYNENGDVTWTDGPRSTPEDYTFADYDAAGRMIASVQWRSQANSDGSDVEAITWSASTPVSDIFSVTEYEYNLLGQPTKITDPEGHFTTNEYDNRGRLTYARAFTVDPVSGLSSKESEIYYTYTPDGRVETESVLKDDSGAYLTTRYVYNSLAQVIRTEFPDNTASSSETDISGRPLISKHIADGSDVNYTRYIYEDVIQTPDPQTPDAFSALTEWVGYYGQSNQATDQYDARTLFDYRGRAIKTFDSADHPTVMEYDYRDRLIKTESAGEATTDGTSANLSTFVYYSPLGYRSLSATPIDGARYSASLSISDQLGRPIYALTIEVDGTPTTNTYGPTHSIWTTEAKAPADVADVSAVFTALAGAFGSTAERITARASYVYDSGFNWVETTTGNPDVAGEFSKSRVFTSIQGQPLITWQYTEDSNTYNTAYTVYDRRHLAVSAFDVYGRESSVTYDGLGRPLSSVGPDGSTTTTNYNLLGNVTHTQLPGGLFQVNEYDDIGRPTATFDYNGASYTPGDTIATDDQFRRYETTYNQSGSFTGLVNTSTDPRGRVSTQTYDLLLRTDQMVISGSGSSGITTQYAYNAIRPLLDSVVQRDHEQTGSQAATGVSYTHDVFGQLRSEAIYTGSDHNNVLSSGDLHSRITHDFDPLGQVQNMRISGGFPASTTSYTYDASARLSGYSWYPAAGATAQASGNYTYDPQGTLKTRSDTFKTMTASRRDLRGLVGEIDIRSTGGTQLANHRMKWRRDGKLAAIATQRFDTATAASPLGLQAVPRLKQDLRIYQYEPNRGKLVSELHFKTLASFDALTVDQLELISPSAPGDDDTYFNDPTSTASGNPISSLIPHLSSFFNYRFDHNSGKTSDGQSIGTLTSATRTRAGVYQNTSYQNDTNSATKDTFYQPTAATTLGAATSDRETTVSGTAMGAVAIEARAIDLTENIDASLEVPQTPGSRPDEDPQVDAPNDNVNPKVDDESVAIDPLDDVGAWSFKVDFPRFLETYVLQLRSRLPSGYQELFDVTIDMAYPGRLMQQFDEDGNLLAQFDGFTDNLPGDAPPGNPVGVGKLTLYDWDAMGRLRSVSQRTVPWESFTWDSLPSDFAGMANVGAGYDWSAVYCPMGRRLKTFYEPVDATGQKISEGFVYSESLYDPAVTFLEIAVRVTGDGGNNEKVFWKNYGPDKSGAYGSLQGIGGLESVYEVDPTTGAVIADTGRGVLLDYFGNFDGTIDTSGAVAWTENTYSGYGPDDDGELQPLATGTDYHLAQSLSWQAKYVDPTGLYYNGFRYYDPTAKRFVSADPLGRGATPDLYGYAGDDPVNYVDPLGLYTHAPGEEYSWANRPFDDNSYSNGVSGLSRNIAWGWRELERMYGIEQPESYFYNTIAQQDGNYIELVGARLGSWLYERAVKRAEEAYENGEYVILYDSKGRPVAVHNSGLEVQLKVKDGNGKMTANNEGFALIQSAANNGLVITSGGKWQFPSEKALTTFAWDVAINNLKFGDGSFLGAVMVAQFVPNATEEDLRMLFGYGRLLDSNNPQSALSEKVPAFQKMVIDQVKKALAKDAKWGVLIKNEEFLKLINDLRVMGFTGNPHKVTIHMMHMKDDFGDAKGEGALLEIPVTFFYILQHSPSKGNLRLTLRDGNIQPHSYAKANITVGDRNIPVINEKIEYGNYKFDNVVFEFSYEEFFGVSHEYLMQLK